MNKGQTSVEKLAKVAKAAGEICQHYQEAIVQRGQAYPEQYKNPYHNRMEDNCVMVPVRLLNKLLEAVNV